MLNNKYLKIKTTAIILILIAILGCTSYDKEKFGPGLSLVEIGERSFELGESYEDQKKYKQALISYQRAIWAFNYHEKLTKEQPLLLDEAEDSVKRLQKIIKQRLDNE